MKLLYQENVATSINEIFLSGWQFLKLDQEYFTGCETFDNRWGIKTLPIRGCELKYSLALPVRKLNKGLAM